MEIPDKVLSLSGRRNLMSESVLGTYFNTAHKYVSTKNSKSLFVINFTEKAWEQDIVHGGMTALLLDETFGNLPDDWFLTAR